MGETPAKDPKPGLPGTETKDPKITERQKTKIGPPPSTPVPPPPPPGKKEPGTGTDVSEVS
jgi:hypothetical protein